MAFMRLAFVPGGDEEHWKSVAAEVGDVTPPLFPASLCSRAGRGWLAGDAAVGYGR